MPIPTCHRCDAGMYLSGDRLVCTDCAWSVPLRQICPECHAPTLPETVDELGRRKCACGAEVYPGKGIEMVETVELTPRRIGSWLGYYREWLAESAVSVPSTADTRRLPRVTRGYGDPTFAEVKRRQVLVERCRAVDQWLKLLTPLERIAADYWIRGKDYRIEHVADDLGVEVRRASQLVGAVPLVIWGHLHRPPVRGIQNSP